MESNAGAETRVFQKASEQIFSREDGGEGENNSNGKYSCYRWGEF